MMTSQEYTQKYGYAVTGSIACGKSTVLALLKQLGYRTFQADQIAFDLTQVGSIGWRGLKKQLPRQYFRADDSLDRKKLRTFLRSSQENQALLENILHPLIQQSFDQKILKIISSTPILNKISTDIPQNDLSSLKKKVFFYEASLIFEKNIADFFAEVIVVYCSESDQIQRLCTRDQMERREAVSMIQAQMSQEEKKKYSQWHLNTSCDLEVLENHLRVLLSRLFSFSSN